MEVSSQNKQPLLFKPIFTGRLNRTNFIIGISLIFLMLITAVVSLGVFVLPKHPTRPLDTQEVVISVFFIALILFLFTIMFISLYIRRLHDLGNENSTVIINQDYDRRRVGWWRYLNPEAHLYPWYYLITFPGDKGPNKYGEPQRGIGILQILGLK